MSSYWIQICWRGLQPRLISKRKSSGGFKHAKPITELFTAVSEELDTFINFLPETDEPDEKP